MTVGPCLNNIMSAVRLPGQPPVCERPGTGCVALTPQMSGLWIGDLGFGLVTLGQNLLHAVSEASSFAVTQLSSELGDYTRLWQH